MSLAWPLPPKRLGRRLARGIGSEPKSPLNLGKYDDPEPDVAVVRGSGRDYLGSDNRVDALLVVEVSDTTLRFDRGKKALRYARAGIADYWVVNLRAEQLEVYREPALREGRHQFAPALILKRGQSIAPLAAPNDPVRVDDLLP